MRSVVTTILCVAAAAVVAATMPASAADVAAGQLIYKEQCARCHGRNGEGTKKHPEPMIGERSVAQLAAVIARTMPEDDPEKCSADDAKAVAQYMYDAFYSPDARARLDPPRAGLARLTVRQYRNAVADLIGSFGPTPPKPDGTRGLRGDYYASRDFRDSRRAIKRVDSEVNFNFGKLGPDATPGGAEGKDKFNPNQFCVRWEGSVTAPETGSYEFVVRTEHALRLWVNDNRKPLIDAGVKSGNDTEYRGSIHLIGGRSYPIKLEFSKGRELKDKKLAEAKPTDASVALLWKPPHGAEVVIPGPVLSPTTGPEVAVVTTPFPPDDRSFGWERGTIVSKEWVAATTDAAIEVAGLVANRLPELSGVQNDAPDSAARLRAFCKTFAERALRRPLGDEERQAYVDRQFEAAGADVSLAVKRVVLLVLTSPTFLYPEASGGSPSHVAAGRLALALWDSIPDRALLDAAAAGKLSTRAELTAHAERMLADPRAKAKVRDGLLAWLKLDQAHDVAKDPKRFPEFDAAAAADLRTSLELSLDDAVWSDKSDFRQLLASDEYFLNGRLAKLYGVKLPPDAPFTKLKLDDVPHSPGSERAGVLTHPYLLSVLAYPADSSPIHRGVFIARGVLGLTLRPPPEAFAPLAAEAHPEFTTRERVAFQTRAEACARCHDIINPLGFPLEQFDAIGRFREKEKDRPIDPAGLYETRAGPVQKFADGRQLATYLAGSEEVRAAFAQQMFHHFAKQPVRAYGLDKPAALTKYFADTGCNVRKLVVEIAVTAAEGSKGRGTGGPGGGAQASTSEGSRSVP